MPEPNWQNPDDYAYQKDLNLHEWAWEFLRRNREYRKAYSAWEELAMRTGRVSSPQEKQKLRVLHREATQPFGLIAPIDPASIKSHRARLFKDRAGVRVLTSWEVPELDAEAEWQEYPFVAVLVFDFRYSIEPQIQDAAEILRGYVRHLGEEYGAYHPIAAARPSFRKGQFSLYSRLLDAELAGATIGKIGRALFSDKADPRRSVTKARDTARYMAKEGYRELLLLAPRPPQKL